MSTIELPPYKDFLSPLFPTMINSITSYKFSGKLGLVYKPAENGLSLENQTDKTWRITWGGYAQLGSGPMVPDGLLNWTLKPNEWISLRFSAPLTDGMYHFFSDITAWLEKETSVQWDGVLKGLPHNDAQLLINGNMMNLEGEKCG